MKKVILSLATACLLHAGQADFAEVKLNDNGSLNIKETNGIIVTIPPFNVISAIYQPYDNDKTYHIKYYGYFGEYKTSPINKKSYELVKRIIGKISK